MMCFSGEELKGQINVKKKNSVVQVIGDHSLQNTIVWLLVRCFWAKKKKKKKFHLVTSVLKQELSALA